jgi:hypothetical protein
VDTSRRDFVQQFAAGAIGLSGLGHFGAGRPGDPNAALVQDPAPFDVSWAQRLKGRHKAVFDCTEPDGGSGAWRMNMWTGQVAQVLKAKPSDISGVIVLRHSAIVLAMQQAFWDKYGLGKTSDMKHPVTGEPTDKNPLLLGEKDGLPAPLAMASLPKQIARGVTVLACNMALGEMVETVQKADGVDEAEARKRAVAGLVPGIILQPSGVFGVVLAQEAGCVYVKAS